MSTSTPPLRIQLTEAHYAADLQSLLRRHKLSCGSPACLLELASHLDTNPALRGDLFNLCTAISHMGESDLSADALLRLVATAAGGHVFSSGDRQIPEPTRAAFLNHYNHWLNRTVDEPLASDAGHRNSRSTGAEHIPTPGSTRFAAASGAQSESRTSSGASGNDPHSNVSRAVSPDMRLGDLTLSELKAYLDQVEGRVERLSPHLAQHEPKPEPASWSKSAPPPPDDLPKAIRDSHLGSEILSLQAASVLPSLAPDAEPATAHGAIRAFRTIEQIAPAVELASGAMMLPPAGEVRQEPSSTMFRSVSDVPEEGSRTFPWLAAAVVLVGLAGTFGYRHLQHTPVSASPASLPSNQDSRTAPDSATTVPALPTSSPAPPAGQSHSPERPFKTRRAIDAGAHLVPREVRMEADAARAEATGYASGQPRQSPRQSSAAPIIRSETLTRQPVSPPTAPNDPQ